VVMAAYLCIVVLVMHPLSWVWFVFVPPMVVAKRTVASLAHGLEVRYVMGASTVYWKYVVSSVCFPSTSYTGWIRCKE